MLFHLNEATNAMLYPAVLHDNDIDVTVRLIIHVLSYEMHQSGLNLTHTQDRSFVQVIYLSCCHHCFLVTINLMMFLNLIVEKVIR